MRRLFVAVRTLSRHPGYSLLALTTLAIGIGCSAAVFSLLDALYFRPIPIRTPQELVRIKLQSPKSTLGTLSYSEYRDIARSATAFQDVIAVGRRGVTFRQKDEVRSMTIHFVSGNYFDALGIPLHLGRGLRPDDDSPQATEPRVVINHGFWQDELGSRPDIIGNKIRLNDTLFTVVGVTQAGFLGLSRLQRTDFWVTIGQSSLVRPSLAQEVESPYNRWFEIIGHVAPEANTKVQVQLQGLVSNWHADNAEQYNAATIFTEAYLDDERNDRRQGAVFLALVGLVLLIACANVANLSLTRGEARVREMAVRAALGGSRTQLMRDALREAVILTVVGALAGVLLMAWLIDIFPALIPQTISRLVLDTRIDVRAWTFTAMLSVITILLVGVVPAFRLSRADLSTCLKDASFGSASIKARFGIRDFLIVAQVTLSVVVLVAAALMVRTLIYSLNVNPGFDTRTKVATFYLLPPYDNARTYDFFEETREKVAALPGVVATSYAIRLPAQSNEAGWADDFTIPGRQPPPGEQYFRIKYTMVGPNYFPVVGTRILSGRGIDQTDTPASVGVAVVNQAMARRFWPNENPIGKTIVMGRRNPRPREIVGVAEDNKIASLYEDQQMYVYVPFAQNQQSFGLLLVEARRDVRDVIEPVRAMIQEFDATVPILDVSSVQNHMNLVLFVERRNAWVAFGLSILALFLSVVGVYGIVSLVTSRRLREIGIRIALGAPRVDVIRLVLGHVWKLAGAGIALGILGGMVAGRLLQDRLHGVQPLDLWSIIVGAATLFAAATLAAAIPCWRAVRVNPTAALRCD